MILIYYFLYFLDSGRLWYVNYKYLYRIIGNYLDVNKYIIVDSVYLFKMWFIIFFKDNGRLNV